MASWRLCTLLALASCASAPTAATPPPRTAAGPEPATKPAERTAAAPAAATPPDAPTTPDRPEGQVSITPPVRISGDPNVLPSDSVKQEMVSARQSRLIGRFKLCIDLDGNVAAVTPLSPSGHPDFDRMVSQRAKTWQYRPGLLDGKPTPACVALTLIYFQPAFSAAGLRLSGLHRRVFDAIVAAPDCRQREQLLHQFARDHAADIAAVEREIEAYDARRVRLAGAPPPHTGFSEDLLMWTGPYVATCGNEEALITALFDAGFRPSSP